MGCLIRTERFYTGVRSSIQYIDSSQNPIHVQMQSRAWHVRTRTHNRILRLYMLRSKVRQHIKPP